MNIPFYRWRTLASHVQALYLSHVEPDTTAHGCGGRLALQSHGVPSTIAVMLPEIDAMSGLPDGASQEQE